MGLGIGRRFKKIFGSGFEGILNAATLGIYGGLKSLLFKMPDAGVPPDLKNQGKAYRADLKQNYAQMGEVRTKIYGQVTDWPPLLCSYTEYENNEQVYKAYLHLSVGLVDVRAIRIGSAPLVSFPGQRSEVLRPGETMRLVHPNVYTSPDVEEIDLRGSIDGFVQMFFKLYFAINSGPLAAPDRIVMIGKTALASVPLGTIQISGTASNNGTRTVTDRGTGTYGVAGVYSWIEISETLVTEGPVDCYLEYAQEDPEAPTIKATDLALVFSSGGSNVAGPVESLAAFATADVVRFYGAPLNASIDYTVMAAPDGAQLMLAPDPVSESVSGASIVLVKRRAGAYPACQRGDKVSKVGLDWIFAALTNNGTDRTVTFEARWREIDDAGNPLSGWNTKLFSATNGDNKPYRMSGYIEIDPPARVEVDQCRLSFESNAMEIRDAAIWAGLRGYVVPKAGVDPAMDPDTTRLAIMVRSSGFLSRQQQKTINVDEQALLPVWDGESWSEPQATRSVAWAVADMAKTQSLGLYTDAHLKLPDFLTFDAGCMERGDTFDAPFDREVPLWEAMQSILRVARAKPVLDTATGQITIYRDEPTAPTLLFADGINCELGPTTTNTPTADTPTGVKVKFVDPSTWSEREDGPVAGSGQALRAVSLFGCTSWGRAWSEASYSFADLRYRVQSFSGEAEMEGLLAKMGGRVLVGSAAKNWGQVMEVAAVDGLLLTLSHPFQTSLNWVDGAQHYVHLQGADGLPTARINCTRVGSQQILLASPHGITLRTGGGWRTVALIGRDAYGDVPASGPRLAMVEDMDARGFHEASLQFRLDDARVHADPGPAPEDPYATSGTTPNLTISNLDATWAETVPGTAWRMSASWDAVATALAYEVQIRSGGEWTPRGTVLGTSFTRGTLGGSAAAGDGVRVRAYSPSGTVGPWAEFERPP